MSKPLTQSTAAVIQDILAHQRHDLMNHVQVLLGYQSMDKPERIKAYLHKLCAQAETERKLAQFSYAPLAVTLLLLKQHYRRWLIHLSVHVALPFTDIPLQKRMLDVIQTLLPWLERQDDGNMGWEQLMIDLESIGDDMYMDVIVQTTGQQAVIFDFSPMEWERLETCIRKHTGSVSLADEKTVLRIAL
ncbi:Spo0B domain-containing protein [Hazenella sp. IB182357]|uniref:Spo0B domain-containing protein n=1 Tax=Polycladospora coralii TaxID=2771432 RepID=A0A926N8J5_9BACL|nr:Spo0B domain-containing protein [Polycladospora coralii]MBD1371767.1 Spo0B domain-containing protein [Polycladospora coralii]